jgi:hypothetical protein
MRALLKYTLTFIFFLNFLLPKALAYTKSLAESSDKEVAYLLTKNEKVYVHLDNSIYVSGENLYYKAYIVNASSHQKELQSKIVYFELLGQTGKRYMFWRSNTLNGLASGSIIIPDTLPGGVYTFRAYTNWMRNNNDAFYYTTNIFVTKLSDKDLKNISLPLPFNASQSEFEFIPDGGHLITNLRCTVGVRVNDITAGLRSINGVVKDIKDSVIASFKIDSFGLANFSLIPEKNNTYKVAVFENDVIVKEYQLPEATEKGLNIEVAQDKKGIILKINSFSESQLTDEPYRLIVSIRGKILKDSILWVKNIIKPIFIGNMQPGITDICILNRYKEPLYEKMIYYDSNNDLPLSTNIIKKEYNSNDNVAISMKTYNSKEGDTLQMSVYVSNKNPFVFTGTNFSAKPYLYFFSEIAGSYCFPNINDSFSTELANKYLLTVKPEEYYWNNLKNSNNGGCYYLSENKGYIFSGRLINGLNNLPVAKQAICLSFADSIPSLSYTITDTAGVFNFLLGKVYDNRDLVLQIVNPQMSNLVCVWELDDKNGQHSILPGVSYELNYSQLKYLENYRKIGLINTIFSTEEKKDIAITKTENLSYLQNFQLMPSYSIFPGDYIDLENFTELTENIMPGVKLKRNDRETNIYIYDPETRMALQYPATVFINGIPFYDMEFVADLQAKEIYRIDVNQSLNLYGDITFYGFVSIVTIDRKIPSNYISSGRLLVKNEARPYIGTVKNKNNSAIDLRTLLFLDQSIKMAGNEAENVDIFTSNLKDMYNISIQGISNNGLAVSKNISFEVK